MSNAGVYMIKNIINGKIYIGSSGNIPERWVQHKYKLKKNNHANQYLQRAYNKYGIFNFKFQVLEKIENATKNNIINLEQKYLDKYKSYKKEIGYNICKKADSTLGAKKSIETKNKYSILMKEFWKNDKNKERMIFSFNNIRDNKQSAIKISKTKTELGLHKGKNNSMYGTNCFNIWVKKYGIDIAIKKNNETLEKNRQAHIGSKNAMFGIKRLDVISRNTKLKSKLIYLYDAQNVLKASYSSITDAVKKTDFSRSSIKKSLYNNIFIKNFIWKYEK